MKKLLMLFIFYTSHAYAVQTNVNKVDDLFDQNIGNKEELFRTIEQDSSNAVKSIEQKEAIGIIPGMEKTESHISELNSISETDLDSAGRTKRASEEFRFYDQNELEPDCTKPGNVAHKQDADDIAKATSSLIGDLKLKLKELNIDCETVKGSIVKEPTYLIDIKREEQKNTEYDQFFCEEPRNKYNCNDTVTLKCSRKGMEWGPWQNKEIDIAGSEMVGHYKWVFRSDRLKNSHFRLTVDLAIPYLREHFQRVIAAKHGLPVGHISTDYLSVNNLDYYVNPYSPAWGGVPTGQGKEYMFPTYKLHYLFREGHEICEEWAEDWNEVCILR